jgi:pimeloyl-ACP methyl ester carboxylesterase
VTARVAVGGGAEVEVFVDGETTARQTFVAAHLFDAMNAQSAALLGRITGGHVVCVNPRGVGGSSPTACPDGVGLLDEVAADLEAVRHALGIGRWSVWGMSAGRFIAQAYTTRAPRDAVERLVLSSAGASFFDVVRDPACVIGARFPPSRAALERAGYSVGDDATRPPASAADIVWESIPSVGDVARDRNGAALVVIPGAAPPAMRRGLAALLAYDAGASLAALTHPTLVFSGDADPLVPTAHARALPRRRAPPRPPHPPRRRWPLPPHRTPRRPNERPDALDALRGSLS